MKRNLFISLAATAVLLAGCMVTSVYPFYTGKDLVFEPALLGDWQEGINSKIHWKFEQQGENAYRLTYTDDNKSYVGTAHSFRLKGELFLDLFAGDKDDGTMSPPIPSHFLVRVFQVKPHLEMAALNHDWLTDFLDKDPKAIRHLVVAKSDKPDDHRIVLTAESADLRKFILKHLNTEGAWKDRFELRRLSSERESNGSLGSSNVK